MDKKEADRTLKLFKEIENLEKIVEEYIEKEEYEKVAETKAKITNLKDANQFIGRDYRKGWEL